VLLFGFTLMLFAGALGTLAFLYSGWSKASAAYFARLERECDASGEVIVVPAERANYAGQSVVYGKIRGTGALMLTDRRVVFRLITGHVTFQIPLSKVRSVRSSHTFNGGYRRYRPLLILETDDPAEAAFLVRNSERWAQAIESRRLDSTDRASL
jgi:hypothetical protein